VHIEENMKISKYTIGLNPASSNFLLTNKLKFNLYIAQNMWMYFNQA